MGFASGLFPFVVQDYGDFAVAVGLTLNRDVHVSGRGMQRFLQFRLGCHSLPVAAGRLAGAAHVDRAHRVCLACNSGAVGDEKHLVFECAALASLRSRYASMFTGSTDTMRSFFAQPDHIGVFHYEVDCLDFMMI